MRAHERPEAVTLALLLAVSACSHDENKTTTATSSSASTSEAVGKERAGARDRDSLFASLTLPHHTIGASLGAHRVNIHLELARSGPGVQAKVVKQNTELRQDHAGHLMARKTTHPQYGQEIIWLDDGWLYHRLRHGSFTKRRTDSRDEVRRLADRMYGALPAYIRLLWPSVSTKIVGKQTWLGREVLRLALRLQPSEPGAADHAKQGAKPLEHWRNRIDVQNLKGEVWLDSKTHVALKASLQASWSFVPPAARSAKGGIPQAFAEDKRGEMTVSLEQQFAELGTTAKISAPAKSELVADVRRLRLEIERQMATGERKLIEEWAKRTPRHR